MALYLPRQYGPPQRGGDIDWSNPLTKNLSFCVIPSVGPIELVGRKAALTTNRIIAARAGGIGFESAGALTTLADAWVFPTKRGQRSALSSVFVGVVNSADAYPGLLASCDGSSPNLMRAIVHGLNDGGGLSNPDFSLTIHGNSWNTFSKVFTASGNFDAKKFVDIGQPRAHGFTWNKDKNSGYGRGFLQGIEVARTSGTAQTTVSDWDQSTAGGFIILANPSTTYGWNGTTQFFAVWERDLEPAEMQEMLANPWQIYKSRTSITYFLPPTGATGGTVSGQILTATLSIVAGSVNAGALVGGTTVSTTLSLIAGSASSATDGTVNGQTLTATLSLLTGSANAGALVGGTTVSTTLSLLSGSVNAGAAVSGQTVSSTMSLIAGSVTAGSLVSGTTLITDLSLIAGSASAIQNATVDGYVFITNMSLITGNAFTDGTVKVYNRLLFSPVQPLIRPLIEKIINDD